MNAVIGFSDALDSGIAGDLNDKQAEYVQDIRDSGHYLLSLINDLLDLSKIEAGMLELEEEEFYPGDAIARCLRLVEGQAAKAGVKLCAENVDAAPTIRADRRLIGQMILNLLSNAIKFTPADGRVSVTVRLSDNSIAISIMDTGRGIAPEDIPLVMQPFRQANNSHADEGTGLGLPLVKQMAELHGGDLTIESEPGGGTTATILLPAERMVSNSA